MIYVFDVDSTLTPSSFPMEPEMTAVMAEFCAKHTVIINSGADYDKMCQQVPQAIRDACAAMYPQLGGECYVGAKRVYQRRFTWPHGLQEALEHALAESAAPDKTDRHIEDRGAMVCFSTVGKAADKPQRAAYAAFDAETGERARIAEHLRAQFPQLAIEIGGQTSINISEQGADKSQILPHLRERWGDPITHFGDKMQPGGTDYPLAVALSSEEKGNLNIEVGDWKETLNHLKSILKKAA